MACAKSYETVSTFVKVMQKKTMASFFWTWCKCWSLVVFTARQHSKAMQSAVLAMIDSV